MWVPEALDFLATQAEASCDPLQRNTFYCLHDALLVAPTQTAIRWANKAETVAAYARLGNRAGTRKEAKAMFSKRRYHMAQ